MATKSSKPLSRRTQPIRSSKASAPWPVAEAVRSDTFAINFFADAITALPRELVRHFTLLKEVDAKIFLPEAALEKQVQEVVEAPLPEQAQSQDTYQLPPTSVPRSGPASLNGSVINGHGTSIASPAGAATQFDSAVWSSDNLPRRQKFRFLSLHLQEMLVSLDEKNHVISTAVEALNKQVARLDDCYPMISNEVSEEARFGNVKHWAYEENRVGRTGSEKTRREAAESNLTAAQQAAAEEIAARSETRKLAVQAKRGKNHQNESDFDDHNDARKPEAPKKLHGNSKIRKAAEASSAVGLGITNGTPVNGNPPPKRRKVEKSTNHTNGASMAGPTSNGAGKGKAISPRDTPMPEPKKKGRAAPATIGNHSRKRNNTVTSIALSPSLQSSPIHSTFAEAKLARASPPPPTNSRPASVRARQNSTHSIIDGTRQRPGSSASNKTNGNLKGSTDLINAIEQPEQPILQNKGPAKEIEIAEPLVENAKEDAAEETGEIRGDEQTKLEEPDSNANGDSMQGVVLTDAIPPAPIISTRGGRASKPSTPAIPSFPENITIGSRSGRSSRNQNQHDHHSNISATNSTTSSSSNKRSHKKGAASAAAAAQQQAEKEQEQERPELTSEDVLMGDASALDDSKIGAEGEETIEGDTEIVIEEEMDEDEPRYCYCNGVSYGEMVGCDAEGCVREWFHLGCVGLKVAPKGNAKWYCDDCKEKVKNSKRGRSSG